MTASDGDRLPLDPARDNDTFALYGPGTFTISPGSRACSTPCLMCRQPVGDDKVIIIGIAVLHDTDCDCKGIAADAWLCHASHWPMNATELQSAISRVLDCPHN